MRETAWVLHMPASTLIGWDKDFDADMKPIVVPDMRGRKRKLDIEMVRSIVTKAQAMKACGKRIRIKSFCAQLAGQGICVSHKKVRQVLIANDLMAPETRKKRPRFYQSLGQKIPNGLLSIDGSQVTVWLADTPFTFNVELAVDVASFTHTGFSIADTETADEIIKVMEEHRKKWGTPIGVVCDHGSANLSGDVREYLDKLNIELAPAGPGNPKGNGTDEGAFSHLKNALGNVRLKMSSPKELAKSVLYALISVYIHMRNRLCLRNGSNMPLDKMTAPVTEQQRCDQRQQLKDHKRAPINEQDQLKVDRLHWIIEHFGIKPDPLALDRARLEVMRMAHRITTMLTDVLPAVLHGPGSKLREIEAFDDEVDALHAQIVKYLGRVSQTRLSEASTTELIGLMEATNAVEAIGDVIETNLVMLGLSRIEQQITVSAETEAKIATLHRAILESLEVAVRALSERDIEAAATVRGHKKWISRLEREALAHQAERLVAPEPKRGRTYRLEIDIVSNLKRIHYFTRRIARTATPIEDRASSG